jgi:uncharacterized protein (DUF58 family)
MNTVSRYLDAALLEHLKHLQLTARSVVQGSVSGLHRSPLKGSSVEFRQHRAYAAGDELRRMDWRVLGRTDRHFIKEYDEETNLRCMLMLDCSGSMAYGTRSGSKWDYAARLVAATAFLALQQNESVGLSLFSGKLDLWLKPAHGPAQLWRILDALDRARISGPSALGQAMHQAAERLDRRCLVIVVSDFFCPLEQCRQGLAHLRHDGHEVVVLQVTDRDEEEFAFTGWRRFRGMENEGAYLAEPALARPVYQQNFLQHRRGLLDCCRLLNGQFQNVVTDRPLDQALRHLLLHQSAGVSGAPATGEAGQE